VTGAHTTSKFAIIAMSSCSRYDVAVRGQTIYVTNHGRRIAAIVPVPVAEQSEQARG
jgi:hypothetical protein